MPGYNKDIRHHKRHPNLSYLHDTHLTHCEATCEEGRVFLVIADVHFNLPQEFVSRALDALTDVLAKRPFA